MTNVLGTTRQFSDAFGNVVKTVDPLGNITSTEYDILNRRKKATDMAVRCFYRSLYQ
jgi:YD repeat-containing protein